MLCPSASLFGHRGDDDKKILLAARLGDHETDLAKFNRFRHRVIEFLAHPRRTIGSLPGDDVIILSQATSSAKVRVPLLMLAKTNIHSRLHQQRDHPVVPVEPIGNRHITFAKATDDLPKQCRLAGFFAFLLSDRTIDDTSSRQREHHHEARKREADNRFLGGVLRIDGLILGSIRHHES